MEVNVTINIKVETLFRGVNVFCEGGGNNTRGRKYFLLPPPGDSVMGETLFRETGAHGDGFGVG